MSSADLIEHATVVLGPFDREDEFYDYAGCALNRSYMFVIDEGILWLRAVQPDPERPGHYLDGESGGMMIGLNVRGDVSEITRNLVARLRNMDALDFLTQVLLWKPGRGDLICN